MFFTLLFDGFIFKHSSFGPPRPLSVTLGRERQRTLTRGSKKTYYLIRMDSLVKPENDPRGGCAAHKKSLEND